MIVYNHGRRWFAMQSDALAWRRQTANPAKVIKVTITNRDELAALLDALCEPFQTAAPSVDAALIDRAYVPIEKGDDFLDYVPRFLLDADGKKRWDERHGGDA